LDSEKLDEYAKTLMHYVDLSILYIGFFGKVRVEVK